MTAIVDTPEEGEALDQPPLLILRPLERFFDAHGLGAGTITAEPVGDGHSNVTYLVRRRGGEWVLRRPPRPPLPPSAHDVLREARLLRALEQTTVRVPRVLATCDDEAVIGAPFYVMERIEGTVINDTLPDGVTPRQIGDAGAALEAEPVGEGHSNVTYLIRRGTTEVVLRRPPRPPLPPSAHDVLREALLLRALERTAVRVEEALQRSQDQQRRLVECFTLFWGINDGGHAYAA